MQWITYSSPPEFALDGRVLIIAMFVLICLFNETKLERFALSAVNMGLNLGYLYVMVWLEPVSPSGLAFGAKVSTVVVTVVLCLINLYGINGNIKGDKERARYFFGVINGAGFVYFALLYFHIGDIELNSLFCHVGYWIALCFASVYCMSYSCSFIFRKLKSEEISSQDSALHV